MNDPILDVDVLTLRGIIAAAEERGRRRGVEEAAKVCDRAKAAGPCAGVALEFARIIADSIRYLAPRDSTPRRCEHCDNPEPHSHTVRDLRDSGKEG